MGPGRKVMAMEKVTSADGTTIAYERSGDGPPVVVVGGAFNHRGSAAPLAALLTSRCTVFTYDRRGRGDSGNTRPYEVEREVEDLAALAGAAGGPVALYGHSSGAALALEAAARGVPVEKLALYEPPLPLGTDARHKAALDMARLTELITEGARGDAAEYFMTMVGTPGEVIAGMRRAPIWPAFEELAPTLVYDTTITADGSLLDERVPAVTAPALVLAGGVSPRFLTDAARATADSLPNGTFRELAEQTHDVDVRVLAPVLLDFV
jgi:pimeloyl-ACP methyl ester carboxylesterase